MPKRIYMGCVMWSLIKSTIITPHRPSQWPHHTQSALYAFTCGGDRGGGREAHSSANPSAPTGNCRGVVWFQCTPRTLPRSQNIHIALHKSMMHGDAPAWIHRRPDQHPSRRRNPYRLPARPPPPSTAYISAHLVIFAGPRRHSLAHTLARRALAPVNTLPLFD